MDWSITEPCATCPYRRSSKLRLWQWVEFENLLANDEDELNGNVFACHSTAKKTEQSVCAGWLLDQKRRGTPSIRLRIALIRDAAATRCHREVVDRDGDLYPSICEMVRANYPALTRKRKHRRLNG